MVRHLATEFILVLASRELNVFTLAGCLAIFIFVDGGERQFGVAGRGARGGDEAAAA